MKSSGDLTADELRAMLRYDSETGHFYWLRSGTGRKPISEPAGVVRPDGYIRITIDHIIYYAHRLAWLYMTGEWPPGQIDHRDGKSNAWKNLRASNQTQNLQNSSVRCRKAVPLKGVHRHGSGFRSRIRVNGRRLCLGTFRTPEAAHAAYAAAAKKYFGDFARIE